MNKFSSSDSGLLLKLAASLPNGSEERRSILAALSEKSAAGPKYDKAVATYGKENIDNILDQAAKLSGHQLNGFLQAFERDEFDADGRTGIPGWKPTAELLKMHKNKRPPSALLVKLLKENGKKASCTGTCGCGGSCGGVESEIEGGPLPDIFDSLLSGFSREGSTLDEHLLASKREGAFERVRELTDKVRGAKALTLPVPAGTKVMFAGHFGSVFAYDNPPDKEATGEVVTVRSATGDITAHDGLVFVKWADGRFLPVHAEYLRLAKAHGTKSARAFTAANIPADVNRFKVSSLGDITSFLTKISSDTLVHKSQKDLWSFSKGADGGVTVQRLFTSNGEALKG